MFMARLFCTRNCLVSADTAMEENLTCPLGNMIFTDLTVTDRNVAPSTSTYLTYLILNSPGASNDGNKITPEGDRYK